MPAGYGLADYVVLRDDDAPLEHRVQPSEGLRLGIACEIRGGKLGAAAQLGDTYGEPLRQESQTRYRPDAAAAGHTFDALDGEMRDAKAYQIDGKRTPFSIQNIAQTLDEINKLYEAMHACADDADREEAFWKFLKASVILKRVRMYLLSVSDATDKMPLAATLPAKTLERALKPKLGDLSDLRLLGLIGKGSEVLHQSLRDQAINLEWKSQLTGGHCQVAIQARDIESMAYKTQDDADAGPIDLCGDDGGRT
ncbi:hypothetical protein JL722_4027 [Aureococcus anophagefferens]|nr:hypothetical protein JL722_4027 [Aureococcus anophagefferens]